MPEVLQAWWEDGGMGRRIVVVIAVGLAVIWALTKITPSSRDPGASSGSTATTQSAARPSPSPDPEAAGIEELAGAVFDQSALNAAGKQLQDALGTAKQQAVRSGAEAFDAALETYDAALVAASHKISDSLRGSVGACIQADFAVRSVLRAYLDSGRQWTYATNDAFSQALDSRKFTYAGFTTRLSFEAGLHDAHLPPGDYGTPAP